MLRDRIITALILVPVLLAAMFIAPPVFFEWVVAAVMLGAAWEWTALMDCATRLQKAAYMVVVALAIAATAAWMHADPVAVPVLVVVALVWWTVVTIWMLSRPQRQPSRANCAFKGLCGLLTLVPAFAGIVALFDWGPHGATRLLFLLALVWLADVGAYFAGHAFGRHKLAPQVSPGKTWEGVGGAFAVALVVTAVGWWYGLGFGPAWYFFVVCLATVAVSIVGDLSESMFKRQQGIKDSGTLLPGHGGLLDRIDSLTSAAPFFVGAMLLAGQL